MGSSMRPIDSGTHRQNQQHERDSSTLSKNAELNRRQPNHEYLIEFHTLIDRQSCGGILMSRPFSALQV